MNKKKLYISLPISGLPLESVAIEAERYKEIFERSGYDVITLFDVCPESDKSYSFYMGKDIEALLDCDAIYLAPGWANSKGCTAEYEVARIYGKEIITIGG